MQSDGATQAESAGEELVNDAIELLLKQPGPIWRQEGIGMQEGSSTLNDTDAQMPSPRAHDPRRTVPRRQKR